MKKIIMAAVFGIALLLAGCGDNGIYGNYKNEQYGLTLKISEKNIEFKGSTIPVVSWDKDEEAKTYTAHTVSGSIHMKMDMHFQKKGSDVVYLGALFKAD